jgi:hypothetical protein
MRIIIILLAIVFVGCSGEQKQTESKTVVNKTNNDEGFDAYVKLFPITKLPTVVKGCDMGLDGLYEFDGKEFSQFSAEYSFSLNQIPSNGNFIALISLGAADCFLPVLTTYSLEGEKIDEETIAIGYCGSDCGYSCSEYMTINEDYVIYVSDTISSSECDSLGQVIPSTTENYVIYQEGKLLVDGKIQLNKEKRVDL